MSEDVITFSSTRRLVGILHRPEGKAAPSERPVVVLLNAGILHRVGPHRLYVRIARDLTRRGFDVLRFDLGGIGDSQDSETSAQGGSFFADTQAAMDMLHERLGASTFMLMGICMGARIALQAALRDERVTSLVLMEGIYIKSARYHISRLFSGGKWLRVLKGENHKMKMLKKRIANRLQKASGKNGGVVVEQKPALPLVEGEQDARKSLRQLLDRGVRIMLVFRDGNETAHNYRLVRNGDEISALGVPAGLAVSFIPFADHTFTPLVSQELLLKVAMEWIDSSHPPGRVSAKIAA